MNPAEAELLRLRQVRLIASRRVTKHGRECDCKWCVSGPRRSLNLLADSLGIPKYSPKKSL